MKKILLALLIFLVPFMVYADTCDNGKVKIKSAIVASREGSAEEIDDISFVDKTIDVNAKFYEVGDSIIYDILIENDSNEDYELDNKSIASNNEHIHYSLVSSENVIKAKTSKKIQLKVEYASEVEDSAYQNGVFTDSKKLSLNLSNTQPVANPFTQTNYITIALIILLVFELGAYFIWSKKQLKGKALLLFITLMMIPVTTIAACKISMDVNSTVQIEKVKHFKITPLCFYSPDSEPFRLAYRNNSTWEEYFNSSLFEELDDDLKDFLQLTFAGEGLNAKFYSNEIDECFENATTEEEYDECDSNYSPEMSVPRTRTIQSEKVGYYTSSAHCK